MATTLKNPLPVALEPHAAFKKYKIGVVASQWNSEITNRLGNGAITFLTQLGVKYKNITYREVAGSFELPYAADLLLGKKNIDGVIVLGCIIQGETKHFDFISQACANGIMQVMIKHGKPIAFGVLTTDNEQQALDRADGKLGNKGSEAAETLLKSLLLRDNDVLKK
jgi:6,7-dimethyl-8-ribityllumazine synthase